MTDLKNENSGLWLTGIFVLSLLLKDFQSQSRQNTSNTFCDSNLNKAVLLANRSVVTSILTNRMALLISCFKKFELARVNCSSGDKTFFDLRQGTDNSSDNSRKFKRVKIKISKNRPSLISTAKLDFQILTKIWNKSQAKYFYPLKLFLFVDMRSFLCDWSSRKIS